MPWFTSGPQTNPAAGAVLADTGQVFSGASVFVTIIAASTVVGRLLLERRNVANGATVTSQILAVSDAPFTPIQIPIPIADGERVRVTAFTSITGSIQCSIFTA